MAASKEMTKLYDDLLHLLRGGRGGIKQSES